MNTWLILLLILSAVLPASASPAIGPNGMKATLRIRPQERAVSQIPRYLTGKFCEHLGANIYNGMDAQILRNPTLADYPFSTGQTSPDGIVTFHHDRDQISRLLRGQAARQGWPDNEIESLAEARTAGLACWWLRAGDRHQVIVSPDTGPHGGRAQRIEVKEAGQGIAQWTYLPLHRVRQFEFEVLARSSEVKSLTVSLARPESKTPQTERVVVTGLSAQWQKLSGKLAIDSDWPADAPYRFAITANSPGQLVIAHVFLRPIDHVGGADPDVVRLLKESRLPILHWPGGNFVSGYHWEDGIGPIESRPTKPNYAWGGVEPNLFGTDEFIAFCRAVGCEPMICINAGDGTPEEAARWVQYCNGPPSSPLGARRAAHGHSEPFKVRHWEIGNELWGRWQVHWTTATGYVDRHAQFVKAMLAIDPTIRIYACGAPVFWGKQWNDTLIKGAGPLLGTITDHPLIGGTVSPAADPLDVYRDFMAVPQVLEQKWAELRRQMEKAGLEQPRLAVTELQMFARLGQAGGSATARLTHENLVNPSTLAEALYDVLVYHTAVRLAPFVEFVTHSATVNHGGGLHKERERVYAHPCHYAQAAFADFAEATPVAVELESPEESAPLVMPDLKNVTSACNFNAIDALAALSPNGSLLISLVHRGTAGHIRLLVEVRDFSAGAQADLRTLSAPQPWARNSLAQPTAVHPVDSSVEVREGRCELYLQPFTVMRVRIPQRPVQ